MHLGGKWVTRLLIHLLALSLAYLLTCLLAYLSDGVIDDIDNIDDMDNIDDTFAIY